MIASRRVVVGLFAGLCFAAGAAGQSDITTARVASDLTRPVYVTAPPQDFGRLFIVEQRGSGGVATRADIRILRFSDNTVLPTPFLTIHGVSTGSEQGLLGLAFHPDYASNRQFFVNFTAADGTTVVRRYTASAGNANVADPASGITFLTIAQPETNHNGGWMGFGPDGFLYIATGDGGGGGDVGPGHHPTLGNGQFLGTLLGKILRIDVDNPAPPRNYSVPATNPFVGSPGTRGEIWAYGLRNPWRCSFDRATGELYIADVGQETWEEINVEPASTPGRNYGWRCFEGREPYNSSNCGAPSSMVEPVHVYSHDFGCSVTGGYVYRGQAIPDLRGTYFFADFCDDYIWTFRYDGEPNPKVADRTEQLAPGGGLFLDGIASFGEDARGELYLCGSGQVFRVQLAPPVITAAAPPAPQGNARFGSAVAGVRDLTGDSRGDVAAGAPLEDLPGGFTDCGRLHVYHAETGALVRSIDPPNKQPGGNFGQSVAGLDNVNGDALGDLIAGAPRQHPGAAPASAGRAYVFSGSTGALLRAHKSPNEQAGSQFGSAVAAAGDLNGDGRTEYLVSAPGETVGGRAGAGRVYVFNGVNGALLRTLWSPNFETGGRFGWSVAGVPDATGDGKPDLLIGAPNDDPGASPADCGRAYLFNGVTFALVRALGSPGNEAGGQFGWSVAGVPSVNGDARGELLIGAPGESPGASPARSGRAYLYRGDTGAFLRSFSPSHPVANGEFGSVVAAGADMVGDGQGDVLIAAPRETVGALAEAGRVYFYSGTTGLLFRQLTSPAAEAGGRFGAGLGVVPDAGGMARPEIAVGASLEDPGATPSGSGRVYVIQN